METKKLTLEELIAVEEIKKIKEYSLTELGIPIENNFNEIDLKKGKEYYFIFASPKNEIRSAFETGTSKFYEKQAWAQKKEKELKNKGYEVYSYATEAHSGDDENGCPITKWMLSTTPVRKTYLVLHEGTHEFIRKNGIEVPDCLEEPICDYVGYIGAIPYFEKNNPSQLEKLRETILEKRSHTKFANKYYDLLTECYKNKKNRNPILKKARKEAEKIGMGGEQINNAFFLMSYYYVRYEDLVFDEFFKRPIKESFSNLDDIIKKLERKIPANALTL